MGARIRRFGPTSDKNDKYKEKAMKSRMRFSFSGSLHAQNDAKARMESGSEN